VIAAEKGSSKMKKNHCTNYNLIDRKTEITMHKALIGTNSTIRLQLIYFIHNVSLEKLFFTLGSRVCVMNENKNMKMKKSFTVE
jgi:hypothetical protein